MSKWTDSEPHMKSRMAIDELTDMHVSRNATQPIGVVERKTIMRFKQANHISHRKPRRDVQTFVECHSDQFFTRDGEWPLGFEVFADRKPHPAPQAGFDRGLIDFAVSLSGMTISHTEQRALDDNPPNQTPSRQPTFTAHVA